MAKKESLKKTDPYKYYRNCYRACQAGERTSLIAPLIAVFAAKWNEYFVIVEDADRIKLSIGCVLSIIMAVIFIYRKLKHEEKVNNKVTMLSYTIGVGVAFVLVLLMKVVLSDLYLILGAELGGSVVAYGVDIASERNKQLMLAYKEAKIEAQAKEAYKGGNAVE